jgi:hypothetical protein
VLKGLNVGGREAGHVHDDADVIALFSTVSCHILSLLPTPGLANLNAFFAAFPPPNLHRHFLVPFRDQPIPHLRGVFS